MRLSRPSSDGAAVWLSILYNLAAIATFIKLTLLDGYVYTWWNWIIVIPINGFLAAIWPIYWVLIRPFFT